jgi:hypothetical protein
MGSRTTLACLPLAALALAAATACSETPQTPLSPSASAGSSLADMTEVADLKVQPPVPIAPANGVVLTNRRPALHFQNSAGSFQAGHIAGQYRIELYRGDTLVGEFGVEADPAGGTTFTIGTDLAWETTYRWRVRLETGGAAGPWSTFAEFRTPDEPRATLPFAVPASCGPQTPPNGNRIACVIDVALASPEWPGCASGSGVRCHRYTRHLAAALAVGDPRWGLITKNPNEQQCTWDSCGQSVRGGYGEDVVAFRHGPGDFDWEGWDVVVGAGAPGAQANWTRLSSRRAGNFWAPVPPFP